MTLTESYEYQFADGTLAHETLRFEFNENGQTDKTIRHITPVFGGFVVGMNGVSSGIPLFNLPAISSLAPGCDILKVEGEKTHRATVRMGYYATTSIGGSASGWASKSDWSPLKGHHVVIIPDNDGPGEKHAGEVVRLATGAGAASVLIVRMPDIWPDAGPGDDIADLEEAVGEERARQMIDEAIERARIGSVEPVTQPVKPQTGTARLVEHTLRDIVSRAVDWLWKNRFAKSTISIIEGDPGQGKSFITLDIAARVSQGFAMPPAPRGDVVLKPRHVILVSAEDGIDTTIKPRLVAMGANEDHVTCIETVLDNPDDPDSIRPVCFPRDLSLLEECIHRKQAAMVVIDPLSAVLTEKADSNKEADMRRVLHQLKLMAERTGVAIVIVRHLNKMSTETNAMYRGGGSIGIIGAARSAFVVGAHPDDEVGDRRILARVKGNLCATPPSLEYRVEVQDGVPVVHWEGEVDITAHELSAKSVSNKDEKRSKAKDFLLEKLAMGEVAADVLEEQARGIGISISTLRRAKNDLGISSRRLEFKGGWMWSLSQ
ncbi:MAG: AAA family ATPase [Gemmatales bacterium]